VSEERRRHDRGGWVVGPVRQGGSVPVPIRRVVVQTGSLAHGRPADPGRRLHPLGDRGAVVCRSGRGCSGSANAGVRS
jgi:hypothetical protein